MKQKLFVLSLDALVREDIPYLLNKPNFRRIMEKRAEVEEVLSVFPSVTYPAHTTLMTGCYPGKHGIYNNVPFKDYNDGKKHWYLDSRVIRVEDIFTAAKRAGCTTASVYWPITGNHPDIDYIINEYFFFYPEEDTIEAFRKMGANEATISIIEKNRELIDARRRNEPDSSFDRFLMKCACTMIRDVQPDVMLVHNCIPDSNRHKYGLFSQELNRGLERIDEQLGEVLEAMEAAGVYEQTNFIILSDHGQMDFQRRTRLNVLLAEGGFVDLAPDGTVYDWQAFSQSNGLSSTVYLRDPGNEKLYNQVYDFLQQLVKDEKYGLGRVYTTAEVKEKYGTYGPFSFMVTGDGKTAIGEVWDKAAIEIYGADEKRASMATHGHEPELGPQPVFMAHGPAFKNGAVLKNAKLVDIAPTLAAVLGQTMPQAQGRCLKELLNEEVIA